MKRPRNDESMAFLSEFLTNNKAPRPLTSLLGEMKDYKVTYPISFALLTLLMRCFPNRNKDLATVMHVNRQISVFNAFLMRSTFAVTTLSPSLYAEQFSQLACGIYSTKNPARLDIAQDLKNCHNADVIMDSNRFGGVMKDLSINSLTKARALLEGIYACDYVSNGGSQVEHILPRSEQSWAQWPGFPKNEAHLYVNRIGNLALLRNDEVRAGTSFPATYREKLSMYRASSYKLTQAIASYGKKWTPKLVQKRQSDLVKLVLKTWIL